MAAGRAARRAIAVAAVATFASSGCDRAAERKAAPRPDPLAPLHAFEEARRRATDFAALPASDRALGADPIAIRALPGSDRFVGLLRGRSAVVVLDASLREIARAPAPLFPTGLAVASSGEILVTGEQSGEIARFHVEGDALSALDGMTPAPRPHGLRDIAVRGEGEGLVVYAVDEPGDRLFVLPSHGEPRSQPVCAGPFRVAVAGARLVVDCLIDHALAVFDLDEHGLPSESPVATIRHDGPIWGFDARETPEGTLIAAGGVEDHPLDRSEGFFGFIDSFVFVYRLAHGASKADRLVEINVSEHGVITPKAISIHADGGATRVTAAGYGSDRIAEIAFPPGFASPVVTTRASLPGVASITLAGASMVAADPLLDAWIKLDPSPAPVAVLDTPSARTMESRVGEALFFTNLMAPWNRTEGKLSRFTCETCHFEGYVDGRTHHTGRADVHATTKPLLGLFNNRPHFTRALDPDMATMVNSEFRVAGKKSDHAPWFSAREAGLGWIGLLGAGAEDLDAIGLRRSLMTFLMAFTHRPNPGVIGRARFDDRERRGEEVFAARCERCHEARLVADDPSSRVAPARWEGLVMRREGPIVWARDGYQKTGVEPYVHADGARTTSLRRLRAKRPYFTNGSAKSLADVLDRARWSGESFFHDRAPRGAEALAEADRAALLAFVELL